MSTCPACRAPTIPEASFCAVCGEKLPEHGAGQSLDAYQRILTLVFVDLVRATQASQSLDLDAYDDLIGNLHGMVDQVVESYRGMVLQRYGDGVLACFGHRRDGEDAVLAGTSAALSLARQSPNRLGGRHVRVGVHAGQVMCRLDQGGRLMPQVTGLHVNLAARLQEQAEIGGVAITWSSLAGLSRLAKVEASAPRSVVLKGIDAPVELVDVSDLTLLGQSLNQPALLERDEVLSQINGARLGDGPGFAITGPAGMGKSSILSGLSGAQAGDVAAIYISARASLSEAPLAPVRATLAKLFDPSSDVAALNADLTAKGLDSTEQEVAVLAHLLHPSNPLPVSLTPEKIRSLSIDVAARVLMHHHRTTTARLLFDDLHWADTDTLACLEKVIAADVVPPSHLIATGRGQPRVQEFIERTGLTEIALAPLSDDASARLIRSELGLDTGMVARIVDMAEGNPLYTLALARHAAQLGPHAENTELPTSIEATFQSIIDACGPQKDVVLMASILGRLVEPRHLRHLLPDRAQLSDELDGLKIEGILQSGPDGLQFGHVLMRDAAYNMIPARRRRSLHAQLANALRTAEPDLCATYPQILADHSLAAEDHDLIPGDCIVAGMHVLRDAGFAPAIRYFASAIESIETAHGDGAKAHPAYLPALSLEASARVQKDGFAHPNVLKSYNRLESAVQGDASVSMERMAALYGLFAHRVISGQLRSCRPMVDEMARIAADQSDDFKILWLVNETAFGLYTGDYPRADAASAALQDIYRPEAHGLLYLQVGADPLASVLSSDMHTLARRGDLAGVHAKMDQVKEHLEGIGAVVQLPWIHVFGGSALYFCNDQEAAWDELRAGIALADAQEAAFWSLTGRLWENAFHIHDGNAADGFPMLEALLAQAGAVGIAINLPIFQATAAKAYLDLGDVAKASEMAQAASLQIAKSGERQWAPLVWKVRAEVFKAAKADARSKAALALSDVYAAQSLAG